MKKVVLVLLLLLTSCGNLTQRDVQTGVEIGKSLLDLVGGLLDRAKIVNQVCEECRADNTPGHRAMISHCTRVDVAVLKVKKKLSMYQVDPNDYTRYELIKAAKELERILNEE